jgi:hypothetical protein
MKSFARILLDCSSRSMPILAGAVLLVSASSAQHELGPVRRLPISAPIKNAGTVDVVTGRWMAPGTSMKLAATNVFNNTCTWTVANYYAAFGECEDSYDEGRVPSPSSPGTHVGAASSQQILELEIGYCTFNATPAGGMNMELAFWNKLNGNCIGGVPVNHSNTSAGAQWTTLANFYLDTSGLALPGSTSNGFQVCWLVTLDVSGLGWTLASDGEGTFDNLEDQDKFIWGKRINDQSPGGSAQPNGFLLSGDPTFSTPGNCTYTNPCQTDVFSGLPCGTGLGSWDGSWTNVDNVAAGAPTLPPSPCLPGVAAYGYGTNCYWFGGYPTFVFDSYYLRVQGSTDCAPRFFCTSKISSLGCTPTLTGTGSTVSKTSGSYTITATPVPGGAGKPGILIWTKNGLLGTPLLTSFGYLCLNQFQRAGSFPASPGGTSGACNGTYNWPFQSIVAATGSIAPGNTLNVQAWYRDPGLSPPGNANFTNGIGVIVVTPDLDNGPCGPPPPPPAPTVTNVSPSSGGEGTLLTISGTNFGTVATDLKVLLADGLGYADVTSASNTSLSATVFKVGATGVGTVKVIRGSGLSLANQNIVTAGITSNSSLMRAIVNAQGSNAFGSFNLTPGSANTLSVKSGTPLPGGLSLDLAPITSSSTGLLYRVSLKSNTGDFAAYEGRIDFVGVPMNASQRAAHLAAHLNASFGNFGILGVNASASGSSVRVSMSGAAYGGIVVAGI